MSRKFTRRSNMTNHGGIHVPFHERHGASWRILYTDSAGQLVFTVVSLPPDSCPLTWLEEQGIVLGVDALAEIVR